MILAGCQPAAADVTAVKTPHPVRPAAEGAGLKTAVFAGGCFWGVEAVFSHVKGVRSAVSGYTGGTAASASYDAVSGGFTDHAEAVRLTYDPAIIRYDQLLRIYFSIIADPTLENRQGPDVGTQYRSALFPVSAEQNAVAKAYIAQLSSARVWAKPIVTRIERAQAFYPAETYHQDFARKNPEHRYILQFDAPKLAALKAMYPGVWKTSFTPG
ncbi:peptide-methionine (S)-S-oxide reductase MsrA [Altererythrobacter aerius]|uniref:Peptide methionine sulfoxide reductase MsrA n=1 Tax=Tsuneonella aeria TaxID=1837929 RepID=A0A6I4TCP7_9SPHN|nr:peptide-methionine (S)-S-oxide reductase MsrA [Tsuneonella aeria]MXO75319.1 peptide-methionine (S)-S-oxide reductase MsrA [Tsuneonella aeria]